MSMDGKKGWAIILIGFGVLLLFNKFSFGIGHLMGYIIPAAIMLLGYIGIKNGSKFFGWVFLVIGGIILFGKLSGFIGILIAVICIGYGCSVLFKKSSTN